MKTLRKAIGLSVLLLLLFCNRLWRKRFNRSAKAP